MTTSDLALFGAFGGVNVGDEAILYSVVEMVRRYGQGANVRRVIFSASPTPAAQQLYEKLQLEIVRKRDVSRLLRTLSSMRLVIGGGQLLNGARFPKGLLFILLVAAINRMFGFRPVMIGVGAENIRGLVSRWLVAAIVRLCTAIGCRDDQTYLCLQRICPHSRVRRTADLVFVSAILDFRPPDETFRKVPVRNRIVVAPHRDPRWKHSCSAHMPELIASLASAFPHKRITVVAHDVRLRFDGGLVSELESKVNQGIEYCLLDSLEKAVDLYADADFVVSSRMHPLIIGMICGARPVALAESGKVKELCRELSLPAISVTSWESSTSNDVIRTMKDWDSGSDETIRQKVEQQRSMALLNLECVTDDR